MKSPSWSYSRYSTYKKCPRQYKFKYVDKLPEPQNPYMERGNVIHKEAEDFLNGVGPITANTAKFAGLLGWLRDNGASAERQITITSDWTLTSWFAENAWLRLKLDADLPGADGDSIDVADWKTGKMYDDNAEQMELYAAVTFALLPHINTIRVHLVYLDMGKETHAKFTRSKDADRLKAEWVERAETLLADTEFAPRPNSLCKFCHWRRSNGGECRYG